jgi:hypothetical protein
VGVYRSVWRGWVELGGPITPRIADQTWEVKVACRPLSTRHRGGADFLPRTQADGFHGYGKRAPWRRSLASRGAARGRCDRPRQYERGDTESQHESLLQYPYEPPGPHLYASLHESNDAVGWPAP